MKKYIANDGEVFGYEEEMHARNDALIQEQEQSQQHEGNINESPDLY